MIRRRTAALALSALLATLCAAPAWAEEHPEYTAMSRATTDYFSTASMLTVYDDFSQPGRAEAFERTWEDVCALLGELDAALSVSEPQSDVSRFNALASGGSVEVSAHTRAVIDTARAVYDLSDGAYDPTVSCLVDLYGFSPRFTKSRFTPTEPYDRERNLVAQSFAPPDRAYVEGFRSLVSLPSVEAEGDALVKLAQPVQIAGVSYEQQIDLGGIGKGYAVDRVAQLLRERGYAYGYFSCGGSSIAVLQRAKASRGAPEAAQWGVAIAKPRWATAEDQTLMRVFMRDGMLSTSGDYEHAYIHDGVRYCHLISPATGQPVNMPQEGIQRGICSATVFGSSAAMCDALSTALCAMGVTDALALMNAPEMADYRFVLVLYSDAEAHCEIVTDLSEAEYELLDEERYRVASRVQNGLVAYTGTLIPQ